jgi:hypothetical protein
MSTKRFWEPSRWNVKANRASGSKEDALDLILSWTLAMIMEGKERPGTVQFFFLFAV